MTAEKPRDYKLGVTCTDPCEVEIRRVHHEGVCVDCGKLYLQHPWCQGCVTHAYGDPEYFIHVLCDGTHAKL